MATGGRYLTIPGLLAGANLASNQFYVVKLASTAGEVVLSSALTDAHLGLLQNDPADGEPAEVAFLGCAVGLAAGSITAGSWVVGNTSGELTATTTANHDAIGRAIEAASSQGDLIMIALTPFNY